MSLFKSDEENKKLLDELMERIKKEDNLSLNDIREHFGLRRLEGAEFDQPLSSFEAYGDPVKEANLPQSLEYEPTEEDYLSMDLEDFEEVMYS